MFLSTGVSYFFFFDVSPIFFVIHLRSIRHNEFDIPTGVMCADEVSREGVNLLGGNRIFCVSTAVHWLSELFYFNSGIENSFTYVCTFFYVCTFLW